MSVCYTWVCRTCVTGKRVEKATVRALKSLVTPAVLFSRCTSVQPKLTDHYIGVGNALKLIREASVGTRKLKELCENVEADLGG